MTKNRFRYTQFLLRVRVQAIRGLPLFCKDTLENIGKMVDILVQILGSEEFVEPDDVHKALMSLLRQDVKVTQKAVNRSKVAATLEFLLPWWN